MRYLILLLWSAVLLQADTQSSLEQLSLEHPALFHALVARADNPSYPLSERQIHLLQQYGFVDNQGNVIVQIQNFSGSQSQQPQVNYYNQQNSFSGGWYGGPMWYAPGWYGGLHYSNINVNNYRWHRDPYRYNHPYNHPYSRPYNHPYNHPGFEEGPARPFHGGGNHRR